MQYYSTKNKALRDPLRVALMQGLAPDGGLYMPLGIPILERKQLEALHGKSLPEIAVFLAALLFGEDIPEDELRSLTSDAIYFDTPLKEVGKNLYSLELFHGPTLAFKDVGARFLARLMGYFARENEHETHILVATSGDTGSAVANGFLGVDGVQVHILYPSGLVSPLQEKQFTTLGQNTSAIEIEGTFDDCQRLVKTAFMDRKLKEKIRLSSANSINLARFLPQAFYYFRAWAQLETPSDFFFAVPSGNYGNMTAGLVAREMGLPVHTFLSANNRNDVVPEYLKSGNYRPRPSVATIANAMDVGNPSNFDRILDLFDNRHDRISQHIRGYAYSDEQIREIIGRVYQQSGYLCDPHGATACQAARTFQEAHPGQTGIFLETAHPAKFTKSVEAVIAEKIQIPERLARFAQLEKKTTKLSGEYEAFRAYLTALL